MGKHCGCCCWEADKTPEQYKLDYEMKECQTKKELKKFFKPFESFPTGDGMYGAACNAISNDDLKMLKYVFKIREKIPKDNFPGSDFHSVLGQAALANSQKCFNYLVEEQGHSVENVKYSSIYKYALEMEKIRRERNHE